MTTEKPDVIYSSPKKTKFEQLRADHELFLQAFESESGIFPIRGRQRVYFTRLVFNWVEPLTNLFYLDYSAFRTNADIQISKNKKCCRGESHFASLEEAVILKVLASLFLMCFVFKTEKNSRWTFGSNYLPFYMGFISVNLKIKVILRNIWFAACISSSDFILHEASTNSTTGEKTVSVDKYLEQNSCFVSFPCKSFI